MKKSPATALMIERVHLAAYLGVLAACAAAVFWMTGPYLLSVFLGGTLAMLAYPLYRWTTVRVGGHARAAAAVTALALILLVAPVAVFGTVAVKQGGAFGRQMVEIKEFSSKKLTELLNRSRKLRALVGAPEEDNERLRGLIRNAGQVTGEVVLSIGKSLPEFALQAVLALIAFYYFLLDGARFVGWLLGLGALDPGVQKELVESFRDALISVVLAGLAAAAAQAALIAVAFFALGVPGAFLAGGLTFIFAWIPILGAAPAAAAGLLYLSMHGSTVKLLAMGVAALAATLVDNAVRPFVLRGRADMHPLVGFVAVIGGIQMFGMFGVFVGPVLAAMLLSLLRLWPRIESRFGNVVRD